MDGTGPSRRSRGAPASAATRGPAANDPLSRRIRLLSLARFGAHRCPCGADPYPPGWWRRDHLSAISAISPEGQLYVHCRDRALDSVDVVTFLEHLRREVSGRLVIIWDGAPIHRRPVTQEFLANGAAQRMHLERLPAYAPELNPGEGLWQQLKGVELRNVCGFNIPHLKHEWRDAVKRVRRKPRLITSFFRGAKL